MPVQLRQVEDRYPNFNFVVEIEGVQAGGFTSVAGLEKETEIIEYREGGDGTTPRKFRGITKYSDITLERGQSSDLDLWRLQQRTFDAFIGATGFSSPVYRFDMYIVQRDTSGQEVLRWKVQKAWVSKYVISDFDANSSEASMESVVVAHEGFYLES